MNWRSLLLIVCIDSWLIPLPVQALPTDGSAPVVPASPELSVQQLSQLAKSITVKVLSGETWGSGILIHRQGPIYTVVTNEHVLTPGYGKPYRIQTANGRLYSAIVPRTVGFNGNDLGVLQFRSDTGVYAVASLGDSSTVAQGNEVFAAGFPFGSTGFVFTTGQISLLLDKALEGGYQIGYTNDIQKGMSGGPLLNRQGQVVGINGRHAYPLWGNGYLFKDGSAPSQQLQEQIIQLSWAVPMETFVQQAGQFACAEDRRSLFPVPSAYALQPVLSESNLLPMSPPSR
ncbi:MAG: serine protease [Coleofasciculus sp. S288]|nr:serine protease [Coleofasciculus sp. S288]